MVLEFFFLIPFLELNFVFIASIFLNGSQVVTNHAFLLGLTLVLNVIKTYSAFSLYPKN